jgi:hypothetical protein
MFFLFLDLLGREFYGRAASRQNLSFGDIFTEIFFGNFF